MIIEISSFTLISSIFVDSKLHYDEFQGINLVNNWAITIPQTKSQPVNDVHISTIIPISKKISQKT